MSQSMPVSLSNRFPRGEPGSHVSAKTREKVEAAMAQLNYIPNRVAQQLAVNSRC
ncbi:LacI family DNA-binding transcriptional regulator [Enterobacter hormaechei]